MGSRVVVSTVADRREDESSVVLGNGELVRLDPDAPESAVRVVMLDELRRLRLPVYLVIDATSGSIGQLYVPLLGRVMSVERNDEGLEVQFAPSHSRHLLPMSAAKYAEVEAALRDARSTGALVLLTEDSDDRIVDVRSCPPDVPLPPGARAVGEFSLPGWGGSWWRRLLGPLRRLVVSPGWPWRWADLESAQLGFNAMKATTCDPSSAAAPCIPFTYPKDGCFARAHEMCRLLEGRGLRPGKIWIDSDGTGIRCSALTRNDPGCQTYWLWHCAPTLVVRTGTWFRTYVIDPALFNEPVPVATWKAEMRNPGASLIESGADDFVIPEILKYTYNLLPLEDPSYTSTVYWLDHYRTKLLAQTMQHGPAPFAHCPS